MFGRIIPRVETSDSVVALTFDDGPWSPGADSILRVLRRADVRVTFFLIGSAAAEHPQDVKQILAAGHEVGNHSFTHQHMVFHSPRFVRSEIERTDSVLRALGDTNRIQFRAPFGMKLFVLPWYLASTKRVDITWDIEPDSYPDIRVDPDSIVHYVVQHARPGSIILLHPWGPNETNRRAIPGIVAEMKARGYLFVSVSDLLQHRK